MNREDERRMRFIGHLPGLALTNDESSVPFAGGHIRTFTADEWREFDDSYVFQGERFETDRPLFLEVSGEFPDDVVAEFEKGEDWFTALLVQLHRAITVVTAAKLPDPRLSMRCLMLVDNRDNEIGNSVVRLLGDVDRELIIFGGDYVPIVLSMDAINEAGRTLGWLQAAAGTPVDNVVAALIRSARPGFSPINQLLHVTIALDSLLVEPDDYANKQAARSYARRLASCLAGPEGTPAQYEPLARLMYKVRSNLVHGRASELDFESEDLSWLIANARSVGAFVVTVVAAWMSDNSTDPKGLRRAMDEAFITPAALSSFYAPLIEVA